MSIHQPPPPTSTKAKLRIEDRVYIWIDNRNRIPWWARFFYPYVHWCPDMDDLLILTINDVRRNCFCEVRDDVDRADFACQVWNEAKRRDDEAPQ